MAISLKHSFTSAVSDGSTTWTGTITNGSNQITSVTPTPTSAIVGYRLYNVNIPSGTTVSSVSGSTITMSANATGSATGATFYTDDKLVQASDWNAEHTLTLASGRLLGRSTAGAGAAEEISVGSGLSLSGGTLSNTQSTTLTVGTTATSGGAAGQIMFDTGTVLQESSNLVWDNTAKRLTLTGYSLTGTSALSQLDLSGTWNTTGTPTLIKANVTNTASNSASLLMDLQVNGSSIFSVSPTTGLNLNYSSGSGALQVQSSLALGSFSGGGGVNLYTTGLPSAADNRLGYFIFGSTSGGTTRNSAAIQGLASAAWVDGSSYPTYIAFQVTASGSTSRTERLRILSSGNTNLGTNGLSYGSAMGSEDLFLTRRGAANLRLGAADAAAPVAQTLSVQSVVAGTTNTAGANLTITGSQGTGTGAGGSIIFQVAPAGSSGTAQNALQNSVTIDQNANILVQSYSNSISSGLGFKRNVDAAYSLIFGLSTGNYPYIRFGDASGGAFITRKGAGNLRFGDADAAAPVAQTLSVQSVVAGTSNTAGANLTITGSQGTGTGAGGDIIFQTAAAGSSGTAQNSLSTALRIYSNQTVAVGKAYTVATLPAAGTQGRMAWVTDATSPTYLGTLTGGGSVVCPVFDNGTAWVAA